MWGTASNNITCLLGSSANSLELGHMIKGILQHLSLGCIQEMINAVLANFFILTQLFTPVDNKVLGCASPFSIIKFGQSDVLKEICGFYFH